MKGPVQGFIAMYSDLYAYKSGVYSHSKDSFPVEVDVAVRLLGWGTAPDDTPYWIASTSQYGPDWGMNGFIWVKRGVDECKIESNGVYSTTPEL